MTEWQSLQRLSRSEASKERGSLVKVQQNRQGINSASSDTISIQDHKESWHHTSRILCCTKSLVAARCGQLFIPRYKTSLITWIILGNVTKMKTEHSKSTPHTMRPVMRHGGTSSEDAIVVGTKCTGEHMLTYGHIIWKESLFNC